MTGGVEQRYQIAVPCALAASGTHAVGIIVRWSQTRLERECLSGRHRGPIGPLAGPTVKVWCSCERHQTADSAVMDSLVALGQPTCTGTARKTIKALTPSGERAPQTRLDMSPAWLRDLDGWRLTVDALHQHARKVRDTRKVLSQTHRTHQAGNPVPFDPLDRLYTRAMSGALCGALERPGVAHTETSRRGLVTVQAAIRRHLVVRNAGRGRGIAVSWSEARVLTVGPGNLALGPADAAYRLLTTDHFCPVCWCAHDRMGVHARTKDHRQRVHRLMQTAWGKLHLGHEWGSVGWQHALGWWAL